MSMVSYPSKSGYYSVVIFQIGLLYASPERWKLFLDESGRLKNKYFAALVPVYHHASC